MKENLSLSIPKPCSEKWDSFTSALNGRTCGSCNKIVVDFTKMGDAEIVDFFTNKPVHTCGRLRPDQLKVYSYRAPVKINPGFTLLKAGLLSLLLLLVSKQTSAQPALAQTKTEIVQPPCYETEVNGAMPEDVTLKGIVKDDTDMPLPGVSISLKGTTQGTMTDVNGRFEFSNKLKQGDVLVFSFIGFDTQEYVVPENDKLSIEISIVLKYQIMMGELLVDGVYSEKKSGFHKLWGKVKGLF